MNKSIIIIYHYVQQPSYVPRMKGLFTADFDNQLQLLLKHDYKIVSLGDFVGFYEKGLIDSEKYAVLTFDDGLKGHRQNVLPVLQKYSASGTFFVMTKPLAELWMEPVHQLHFVLAAAPMEAIRRVLNEWLRDNGGQVTSTIDKELLSQARRFYLWDSPETAYLKYLLNTHFEEPDRSLAIRYLFDRLVGGLEGKAAQFYLNAEDLKKMRSSGMEIGSHIHSHRWLAKLSREEQEKEISLSKTILEGVLSEEINLFSYPYGTSDTFTSTTVELLKDHHYRAAVTTNQGYAVNSPHVYSLSRVDTNEVETYIK